MMLFLLRKQSVSLALTISVFSLPCLAAGPINTINDGSVIKGGTYYNTVNSQTSFIDRGKGGLWLQNGTNLRGIEVDTKGQLTGNGGNVHLFAPNSVVRIDGNIDVRGIPTTDQNEITVLGDGGKVFIDAAYLFEKGNIYASGGNGGIVQFNVGSATIANGAMIDVHSLAGSGGIININASGVVDIARQAVLNSTGNTTHLLDTNVINIEGGLVNIEGRLIANGLEDRGGTIRLVSSGKTDVTRTQDALQDGVTGKTFSSADESSLISRLNLLKASYDGDVRLASGKINNQADLEANGGNGDTFFVTADPTDPIYSQRAPEGGSILVTAAQDVLNGGHLSANGTNGNQPNTPSGSENGGNGGTINLNAGRQIVNSGRLDANGGDGKIPEFPNPFFPGDSVDTGHGGNGGLIAFSYRGNFQNEGVVRATGGNAAFLKDHPYKGGNGGLIVYAGMENPTGKGINDALPGSGSAANGQLGTIVLPDSRTSINRNLGTWEHASPVEVAVHDENLFVFNRTYQAASRLNNMSTYLDQGTIRSIYDQSGKNGQGYQELLHKSDLLGTSNPAYDDLVLDSLRQEVPTFRFRNVTVTSFANTNSDSFDTSFSLHQTYGTSKPFSFKDPFSGKSINLTPIFSLNPSNTITLLQASPIALSGDIRFGGGLTGGHFSSISLQGDTLSYDPIDSTSSGNLSIDGTAVGGTVHLANLAGSLSLPNLDLQGQSGGSVIAKARDIIGTGNTNLNGQLAGGTEQYLSGNNLSINSMHQFTGGLSGGNLYAHAKDYIFIYLPAFNKSGGRIDGSVDTTAGKGVSEIVPCGPFCD